MPPKFERVASQPVGVGYGPYPIPHPACPLYFLNSKFYYIWVMFGHGDGRKGSTETVEHGRFLQTKPQ